MVLAVLLQVQLTEVQAVAEAMMYLQLQEVEMFHQFLHLKVTMAQLVIQIMMMLVAVVTMM